MRELFMFKELSYIQNEGLFQNELRIRLQIFDTRQLIKVQNKCMEKWVLTMLCVCVCACVCVCVCVCVC